MQSSVSSSSSPNTCRVVVPSGDISALTSASGHKQDGATTTSFASKSLDAPKNAPPILAHAKQQQQQQIQRSITSNATLILNYSNQTSGSGLFGGESKCSHDDSEQTCNRLTAAPTMDDNDDVADTTTEKSGTTNCDNNNAATNTAHARKPDAANITKPPLPPPPPKELVRAFAANAANQHVSRRNALQEQSLERDAALNFKGGRAAGARTVRLGVAAASDHPQQPLGGNAPIISKELKHKRTSSIRSALRHAHLGPLRSSFAGNTKRAAREAAATALAAAAAAVHGNSSSCVDGVEKKVDKNQSPMPKSRPYELFEPPVTQRTFERIRRRGAMQSTSDWSSSTSASSSVLLSSSGRRQMSVDTIGLRQLTDEYLQNAGVAVQPARDQNDTSGHHAHCSSLVALEPPPSSSSASEQQSAQMQFAKAKPGTIAVPGGSSTFAAVSAASPAAASKNAATNQAQCALEAHLFQATRQAEANVNSTTPSNTTTTTYSTSESPTGHVTILPGSLPWQCDVSIQCELLQAPPAVEPYETTGDILNTIARPFRGLQNYSAASFDQSSSWLSTACQQQQQQQHHHNHHLSATLKRGLSAISQHHLSPVVSSGTSAGSMALNAVVGNLKKSISNTFDVVNNNQSCASTTTTTSGAQHAFVRSLRSQDSLPAYASLQNEPDDEINNSNGESSSSNHATLNDDGDSACESRSDISATVVSIDNNNKTTTSKVNQNKCQKAHVKTTTHLNSSLEICSQQQQQQQQSGLIGQLASKLTRQSSKKFAVSRKGLQRALSFDCRGYKRLAAASAITAPVVAATNNRQREHSGDESSSTQQLTINGGGGGNLLVTKQKSHNKSTLALHSPRPYLPQSASQVDFQVPLLPYERMQEAIVSQRLLEPPPLQQQQQQQQQTPQNNAQELQSSARKSQPQQPDLDELICGTNSMRDTQNGAVLHDEQCNSRVCEPKLGATKTVLNNVIPTITTSSSRNNSLVPNETTFAHSLDNNVVCATTDVTNHSSIDDNKIECEKETSTMITTILEPPCLHTEANEYNTENSCIVANSLLAPIDSCEGQMSQSPSFCIEQNGTQTNGSSSLLTASDVFNRSKNFIKRPSTMCANEGEFDAINQFAQALESKSANNKQQQQVLVASGSVRRNRRQAIVPPKLATDAGTSSESESREPEVGNLVDITDNNTTNDLNGTIDLTTTIRRKRSGGGIEKVTTTTTPARAQQQLSNSNARTGGDIIVTTVVPRLHIDDKEIVSAIDTEQMQFNNNKRPDSQATNADLLVSSESSTALSTAAQFGCGGRMSAASGASGTLSPLNGTTSLSVPFAAANSTRRRSSIAVIPQMQICPGDLLVYSKQLIERMNQSDENEPPQFLTIDDKKGKNNIWSSFKLCAQFDNRSMRARNEILCSLEDVLASLQPSTFVDEQLSHYKGMVWSDFLFETESRRSASSDGLNNYNDDDDPELPGAPDEMHVDHERPTKRSYHQDLADLQVTSSLESDNKQHDSCKPRSGSVTSHAASQQQRDNLKTSVSTGLSSGAVHKASGGVAAGKDEAHSRGGAPLTSRFREKPKLKRGQTVDSVFRIPLIPSSPLKHAQLHQQTPTAHLEERHGLNTIDDDERSSISSSPSGAHEPGGARKRSSSTRSRSGSRGNQLNSTSACGKTNDKQRVCNYATTATSSRSQESSFDADDANDLLAHSPCARTHRRSRKRSPAAGVNDNNNNNGVTTTPNQIVRQSSLSTLSSTVTRTEQKRQRALWDLFQSECTFFFDHLMTLKNVYMEPLKKIQVEGFAMFADPDVLFGNLDELCCDVYDFCKEFLYIIMRTLKTRPEELNATDVLIKLYKKNPKIDHLRAVYHRYTLNYINALTYLESLRRQVEFVEFEKWSSRDVRCKKLQLTDLLVAPVQHIMRVPIILKDIEAHTECVRDRDEIRAILAVEEASLRELDDKMRWLKNFERLLEIQKNISWPSVVDMDNKLFVPEFLKEVLCKQPCEKLIVSPRRQIVHEGTLINYDLNAKPCDMHVILFDDMLLMTRRKKCLTKKASTVCKTNSTGASHHHHSSSNTTSVCGGPGSSSSSMLKDDGTFKYIVYKQPLSLDRFYVHDLRPEDCQTINIKNLFLLIVMNRFQQIINVHSFASPSDDIKSTWLFKIKKTTERWKRNYSSQSNSNDQQQQQQQQQQQPPQQQQPQPQQQQVTSSLSMPMEASQSRTPTNRTVSCSMRSPTSSRQVVVEQTDDSSSTFLSLSAQRQDANVVEPVKHPIEFVITSASESPASCGATGLEQVHKCRL